MHVYVLQRYVKCPLELQALQLEIVINEDTERETQRQVLKVGIVVFGCRYQFGTFSSSSALLYLALEQGTHAAWADVLHGLLRGIRTKAAPGMQQCPSLSVCRSAPLLYPSTWMQLTL